jgi:hypothetical protein
VHGASSNRGEARAPHTLPDTALRDGSFTGTVSICDSRATPTLLASEGNPDEEAP